MQQAHNSAERSISTSKIRILLVDDQPANLLVLDAVLGELHQELVRATSGEEALRLLLDHDFAVVLLDVQMDGLDGFETARLIRERERSRHTPIIFLTAYESSDFPIAKAYALGAVDYLVKPLVPEILRAKVAVFVELYRLREAERRERRGHVTTHLACTRALAESATVIEALPRLLGAICEGLGWDWGAFWSAKPDNPVLCCAEVWHVPSFSVARFDSGTGTASRERGSSLPDAVWAGREAIWVQDITQNRSFSRLVAAAHEGLRTAFAFPIDGTGALLGVMELFSHDVRAKDAEMIQLLAVIGNQLGQFIHRKQAEDELRRSQQELRDFVENATVGLHWVGPDGTILWANQAEFDLLGFSREEYIGHHIKEFHVDPSVIDDILNRLTNREELHSYEARLRCKDGSIRHVLINSNVLWEGNRFCHSRCFTRDITDRKCLEEALRQRAEELTEASRRKDQFLAMLAHELRNPLAPVLNGLQILGLTDADRQTIDQVRGMMERQIYHLTRLVDDLLDVSRLTRGMVQVRREQIDLAALVRTTTEDRRQTVEKLGMKLVVEAPETPVWIAGDPTRLAQVLNNLLDNAVKFRDGGNTITARLSVRTDRAQAIIEVLDEGIGIAPYMFPRLFDAFNQGDRSLDRSRGGLGLGLSLVKGLVELHGGAVYASSGGPGRGAAFTVELPLKEERPALAESPVLAEATPSKLLRILVVEDNRDAADSLCMLLELLGHQVTVARTGPDGVRLARVLRPDVLLCDIGLPDLDGYGVAGELRNDPATAKTCLVALTGYGQDEDRRRAREAGFHRHLTKPVNPATLRSILTTSA